MARRLSFRESMKLMDDRSGYWIGNWYLWSTHTSIVLHAMLHWYGTGYKYNM